MYKVSWDKQTGGVRLHSDVTPDTLGITPRPVFWEELDLLKLNELGWTYPHCEEPLLWACNKQYFYRSTLMFEAKGANIYDPATIVFRDGNCKKLKLKPIDVAEMLRRNKDYIFLLESEAIEFIRDTYLQYSAANRAAERTAANQLDYNTLLERAEKKTKRKMAIVKEDCDSFDIVPLDTARESGKRIYQTTKIDRFLASFSGGKDSQVVLDLCTRAIPSTDFEVIYSDTGYELPPSLKLYEDVRQHYTALYPDIHFSIARNHDSVLNYWDKIGTPSDTHRWCCSVMKTAPLYRMLKIDGTNKQAKSLAFEGTRAEESVRRSEYERIGKGVKHNNVINARPILNWNTTEVFLYLFKQNIPLNTAYRLGKPRVGCLICPFSSEWDDMIVSKAYPVELQPFINRLVNWAKERNIPNLDEYIKGHKWRTRASGKYVKTFSNVLFKQDGDKLTAEIKGAQQDFFTWLHTLGTYQVAGRGRKIWGELKYKDTIINFHVENKENNCYSISFKGIHDVVLAGLIKRVLYKSTFCIQCEACEVNCPTGALSVYPTVTIDNTKCVHCFRCLNFHNKGCIAADSLSMSQTDKEKLTGVSGYGTFGLRDEWLAEFAVNREDFWTSNSLGKKQIPSFKNWLKDAGILDSRWRITSLGEILLDSYQDMPDIVWQIIWINLSVNSPLVKWFISNIHSNMAYSKKYLQGLYEEQFTEGYTTFRYALDALYNTLTASPIGENFLQKVVLSKDEDMRKTFNGVSEEAVVYSLYKYGECHYIKSFRVTDLWESRDSAGIFAEFCIDKMSFEKTLRSLDSASTKVLVAELNMGLDNISLRDDLNSLSAVKLMLGI